MHSIFTEYRTTRYYSKLEFISTSTSVLSLWRHCTSWHPTYPHWTHPLWEKRLKGQKWRQKNSLTMGDDDHDIYELFIPYFNMDEDVISKSSYFEKGKEVFIHCVHKSAIVTHSLQKRSSYGYMMLFLNRSFYFIASFSGWRWFQDSNIIFHPYLWKSFSPCSLRAKLITDKVQLPQRCMEQWNVFWTQRLPACDGLRNFQPCNLGSAVLPVVPWYNDTFTGRWESSGTSLWCTGMSFSKIVSIQVVQYKHHLECVSIMRLWRLWIVKWCRSTIENLLTAHLPEWILHLVMFSS